MKTTLIAMFVLTIAVWLPAPATAQESSWLTEWLSQHKFGPDTLEPLRAHPSANRPLTRAEADAARKQLWEARRRVLRESRADEMQQRQVTIGDHTMPFWYKVFGEKPADGRRLFISMHGGGGAPARVNDSQYENQKRLYQPEEGVYLVPRAPTDTWNLWHQGHIDKFFDRLITNMIVFEDVNPNRVCIMGYSAGGDGVYQLAPRMADRWAAAAMMAGHPNEARPDNLRNVAFTIHMGGADSAYRRNAVAAEWKKKLADLQQADPQGYVHEVRIHEGLPHWMNRKDAVAVPWMSKFTRDPFPPKVVWYQDDVTHSRMYWLAVSDQHRRKGTRIVASRNGNEIRILESDVPELRILLPEERLNLDQPVRVLSGDSVLFDAVAPRTVATLAESLLSRDDPAMMVPAQTTVRLSTAE